MYQQVFKQKVGLGEGLRYEAGLNHPLGLGRANLGPPTLSILQEIAGLQSPALQHLLWAVVGR